MGGWVKECGSVCLLVGRSLGRSVGRSLGLCIFGSVGVC